MTPTDEQKATEKARQLLSKKCATPQEHGWWVTPDNRAACLGCLTAALLAWGEEKRKEALKETAISPICTRCNHWLVDHRSTDIGSKRPVCLMCGCKGFRFRYGIESGREELDKPECLIPRYGPHTWK